jgi:SET domain-containing protein
MIIMNDHLRHSTKVEIRPVPGKGSGVFSLIKLKEGELIEECPFVPLSKEEGDSVREVSPTLRQYIFYTDHDTPTSRQAMVLGYGALYNHSYTPNVVVDTLESKRTMSFVAKRDIEEGEELTFDYDLELWFEPA